MRTRQTFALAAAVLAVAPATGFALSGTSGGVTITRERSGFDAAARVSPHGSIIRIAGPVRCTRGGRLRIDVTITQRASGALARGTWRGRCRGTAQRWTIRAARALTGRFVSGEATACAAAAAADSTHATDALQWCRVVALRQ